MAKILVTSLSMSDAGKTSTARALLNYAILRNIDIAPFKPVGECWLYKDWSDIYGSACQKRLYGNDSFILKKGLNNDLTEEMISPVFRVVSPARHDQIEPYNPTMIARCSRLTNDEELIHEYAVNISRINESSLTTPFNWIMDENKHIHHFNNQFELDELTKRFVSNSVSSVYKYINNRFKNLVIESSGFSAMPWIGFKEIDYVIAVNHGYIQLYCGVEYVESLQKCTASEVNSNWLKNHEDPTKEIWKIFSLISSSQVVANLSPIYEIVVPPLLKTELVPVIENLFEKISEHISYD